MNLRAAMIRGVSGALYHTGLVGPVARGIARTHPRPRVQILTFHRVNDDNDPFLPSLPTAVFAARMAYIARHYRVMTVEDLAAALQEGRVPKNFRRRLSRQLHARRAHSQAPGAARDHFSRHRPHRYPTGALVRSFGHGLQECHGPPSGAG